MKVSFDDKYDFVPNWNGNKEDASPIIFHCRYLSTTERARCLEREVLVDGEKTVVKVGYKDKELFTLSIESIENFEANGKKMLTAADVLASERLGTLFDECVNEFVARNARKDLKN